MYTCGIIGHRDFEEDINLIPLLEELIFEEQVHCFNFGAKSKFVFECARAVEKLQKYYPFVKMRIFLVRGEMCFLKGQEDLAKIACNSNPVFYDEVYEKIFDTGKLSYIKRDRAIIENSDIIFCYCKCDKVVNKQKVITSSGTALAIEYARKLGKRIINIAK